MKNGQMLQYPWVIGEAIENEGKYIERKYHIIIRITKNIIKQIM